MAAKKFKEIEVYGMKKMPDGSDGLAPREEVEYWDVCVRETEDTDDPEWTGEINILEEYEYLTAEQASQVVVEMRAKYPDASEDDWITA